MPSKKLVAILSQFFAIFTLIFYPIVVWAATATDTTCAAGQFGSGTDSDTQCSGDQVELDATGLTNGSGNFTSRVIDSGGTGTWSSLGWTPESPYLKDLPDSGGADSDYSTGTLDMTNNILLYHLNESSGDASDSSANSHTGTVTGATQSATGKLGDAYSFDGNDRITVSDHNDFSINTTGDLSVAFWMKTGANVTSLQKIFAKGGCSGDSGFEWTVDISSSKIRAAYSASNGNSIRVEQSSASLSTGTWYHVVVVFTGATSSDDVKIYLNGIEGSSSTLTAGYSYSNGTQALCIATGYGGHVLNYFSGTLDEVAIFSDQVTAAEAWSMYKRGANRLKYQVRSCDDSACSGESFIGPDGTGSTYYSELTSAENGLPSKTLSNVDQNRYFQYKAYFETDNSGYTPELLDITVTYSVGSGIPEFSDAIYVVTMLFGGFYVVRLLNKEQGMYLK
ncbi:LamG domain-containing protein [Candidatus Nomurabacteria bacterium]|nr:LamG domain-containing protein [Candidatus Nomurabacteria bacterium]